MRICLRHLKQALEKNQIKSCRISRDPFILDESSWRNTKDELRTVFEYSNIKITICENIITVPPVEKRSDIIAEYHI